MPDWDDLRFFLAVYRSGSLTAAARVLGCSQPTVGRRIAALAGTYGAALLESRAGRYAATTVGRRVLARAERIEREIGGIAEDIDRVDERPQGSVRVSVPEGAGLLLVAPRLAEFRRAYPAIDLVLVGEHGIADLPGPRPPPPRASPPPPRPPPPPPVRCRSARGKPRQKWSPPLTDHRGRS